MNPRSRSFICTVVGLVLSGGASAVPVVSDVTLTQKSPNRLYIDYKLSEPAVVTFDVLTNGVSIGRELLGNFTGDCRRVVKTATGQIAWTGITHVWPDVVVDNKGMTAVVKAWPTNSPPDYMVVDLTGTNGFPHVQWYEKESDLPGGTVLQDIYKTDLLVMKRIHAAGVRWRMGKMSWENSDGYDSYQPAHDVVLSNDYYLGVFELTQRQCLYVKTDVSFVYAGHDKNPAEHLTFAGCRGSPVNYNFVTMGHKVPNGFFTNIREKANGICFDFPTSAQWEFACRAGTRTVYHNGSDFSCRDIAWTSGNWRDDTSISSNMTHEVGLLGPNAFGLYDMIGNVWEVCVDRAIMATDDPDGYYDADDYYVEEEPIGPESTKDNTLFRCGGSYKHNEKLGRSASRIPSGMNYSDSVQGVRLWCACEAK